MVDNRPLPLDGVVVLDLGQIYQGPYAGFLMANSGARVIKIEPVAGEGMRLSKADLPYAMLNANKESTTIDLKQPEGVALFKELVAVADVVLMNYAPGVPERLGIGFDDLIAVNPRLVFAHAAGFGVQELDGSVVDSSIPAMDITVQAHSGAMSTTGYEDTPPLKAGVAYIDFLGGTHLYAAITTALFERERTGQGRSVEIAMADAAHFTLATALGTWQETGATQRNGNRHANLAIAPYNAYRCADGWVAVICVAERHWTAILSVIDREDLDGDERFRSRGRRAHNLQAVDDLVEAWTSQHTKADVAAQLQAAHVPAAAVRDVDEVVRDERQHARKALQWVERDGEQLPLAASPIRWHGSDVLELEPYRALGADNDAVFRELAGQSTAQLAALRSASVIAKN